jgi:hypothetical protein
VLAAIVVAITVLSPDEQADEVELATAEPAYSEAA